jgi:hypothetical protein
LSLDNNQQQICSFFLSLVVVVVAAAVHFPLASSRVSYVGILEECLGKKKISE